MSKADYVIIVRNLRDSLDPRTRFAHCPRCHRTLGPWDVLSRRYLASTLQSLVTQCPCRATVEILPGADEDQAELPPLKPWFLKPDARSEGGSPDPNDPPFE